MKYKVGDRVIAKIGQAKGEKATIKKVYNTHYDLTFDNNRCYPVFWTDEIIEGFAKTLTHEEFMEEWANFDFNDAIHDIIRKRTEENMKRIEQTLEGSMLHIGVVLPEGYEFRDENGNVINATKIVLEKKKKKYPKTYEECCEILDIIDNKPPWHGYRSVQLKIFQKLLVCRDAYWKLYGEEMGLGKPWKPDLTDKVIKHCIEFRDCGVCKVTYSYTSKIFAFPTAEMRDAFYENFKSEIEICKELL